MQERVPDSPLLRTEFEESRAAVEGLGGGGRWEPGALTTAELRVLDFLPTHLSFREIGDRMHLSRFTIKSQALSAYRKLGVSSRSDAVARARALGLIDRRR
ncbi:MAG: response regulator transcription factor [Thermoleophilia bacterium]